MKLLVVSTVKGGKGSGWFAPPRGDHTGTEHRATGSSQSGGVIHPTSRTGTSNGRKVKMPKGLLSKTNEILGLDEYFEVKFARPVQMLVGYIGSWSQMQVQTLTTPTVDKLSKLEKVLQDSKFVEPYKVYEVMDGERMEL